MHCNGRCEMMKKLKSDEKKDADNPERKQVNKNETFSPFILINELNLFSVSTTKTIYWIINDNRSFKMPRTCFHPPGTV